MEFSDSTSHEYYLLAVRDSALVVGPGYYDRYGPPLSIPFSKIMRIYHGSDGKTIDGVLGGAAGFVAAMATMLIITPRDGDGLGAAVIGTVLAVPAIIAGVIIGANLSSDENSYDLSKSSDRKWVKNFSKYPNGEPPELQKIKYRKIRFLTIL